jgi:hypothetical protein
MDVDEFGRLPAQGNFCAIYAINGRVSSRRTAKREYPVFRDKPKMHKLPLNLLW